MNVDKFGIVISIVIMVGVLGVAGIASGEFVDLTEILKLEDKITQTSTSDSKDSYYMWCFKMGLECK